MLIRSLLGDREGRAISYQQAFASGLTFGGPGTASGVPVDAERAQRLPVVHACVTLIADSVGQLPIDSISHDGAARIDHGTPRWVEGTGPVSGMSAFEKKEAIATSMATEGHAYLEVVTGRHLEPTDIAPLNPNRVEPVRNESTGRTEFRVRMESGEERIAPAYSRGRESGILDIPLYRVPGKLKGQSPIGRAREAIGVGLAAEEFGARFYRNGTSMPGVIELDKPADPEVMERLKAGWEERNTGMRNAHRPGVLSDGATWRSLAVNPDDAQFIETRKFQVNEIARLFRVPPHMVADVEKSTSWGTGIEEQGIAFVTYTLGSYLARIEQRLSILEPRGRDVKLNPAGLLRGNVKGRYSAYQVGRVGGWLSVNDVRAFEDMDPIEGGDDYLQPLNMAPINDKEGPDEDPTN